MVSLKALAVLATVTLGVFAHPSRRQADLDYEYIVVGAGAGGGPVAARLALAGHKTLLIEAGDDQGADVNYTVPTYNAKSTEDPVMSWDFFVRHYADDSRQAQDYKLTYSLPDGSGYTGLDPPEGATIKGILYPRGATLGGSSAHNALVTIYPDESDFEYIASLTGDASWNPDNLRSYWSEKIEANSYLEAGLDGHGYDGWLGVSAAPLSVALADTMLLQQIVAGANAVNKTLADVLVDDANANSLARDQSQGAYQVPIATKNGARNSARELILSVSQATRINGAKQYPLDVRVNCLVTKVTFDESTSPPRATGVEFLDGKALYRADSRSKDAAPGTPGSASASREVIVSGGAYNSPQILKLSGIGPAAELESFNISVIADLPGVGTNLQDHYEVTVQGTAPKDFTALDGCNFGFDGDGHPIPALEDPCYVKWLAAGEQDNRGTYATNGFAEALFVKTTETADDNYDQLVFGGPVNFRGYYPGYSYNATMEHNWWSWAILRSHPRNTAGTVKLRSADPLDTPDILFNYFDTGNGDWQADLDGIAQAIGVARAAFADQTTNFTEVLPGAQVTSKEDIETYVKNTAWGHHCSCTCPIGADDDPNAVLDSSFRVRGVTGLRVVDASVYPKIPGTFTAASTYLVGEKAADVILSQLSTSSG